MSEQQPKPISSFRGEEVKALYGSMFEPGLCERLVDMYDKCGRQLYNLGKSWDAFKNRQRM